MTRRAFRLVLLSAAMLLPYAGPASAQQSWLQPPAQMDAKGRCVYFSRLVRFTAESKSVCDEGRKVKTGPVTAHVLDQCLAQFGHGFDTTSITDMTDAFAKQVQSQGFGNACNQIKAQAWDLVAQ
ncbi:hypothetical protein NFI95_07505 [Acetobacteraceae bacterium KSS8]|uniref:Uncharacterized protein n=1 Tax=Endosaccharibacter trunci TaxID=2812733 RepID=A0ABT1W5Z0_9PROT|nr:hypothetical protein [Acetobacteraceae bacterium KSS8]